jgi:hypothetical protein
VLFRVGHLASLNTATRSAEQKNAARTGTSQGKNTIVTNSVSNSRRKGKVSKNAEVNAVIDLTASNAKTGTSTKRCLGISEKDNEVLTNVLGQSVKVGTAKSYQRGIKKWKGYLDTLDAEYHPQPDLLSRIFCR